VSSSPTEADNEEDLSFDDEDSNGMKVLSGKEIDSFIFFED
jgi:hypothetical protein